jgi:hypothetical protein
MVAAGALLLASGSNAQAQFSVAVGNPLTGGGVYVGGAPAYGYGYSSFYGAPLTGAYSSGYAGVVPGIAPYSVTTYSTPLYGYSAYPAYGYGVYGVRRGLLGRRWRGGWAAPGYYPW